MKDKICETLGQNIKKYRKLQNYTQEKLAEAIGIEIRTLSLIETGRSFISSKTLSRLSEILNINPANLFENSDYDDTEKIYDELIKTIDMLKNNPVKLRAANNFISGLL